MSTPSLYNYRAKLLRVIDGDTVDLEVDLGLETYRRVKCRLYGLNAPEKSTDAGKAAAKWLTERMGQVKTLYVQTIKDRTEKYGRYLVILFDADGLHEAINTEMVDAGHAVEYYGGKR
jgi:micrococcal nuclease